jgi:oxygen-independent coproporphyrinogen-3 oxidase
LSQAQTHAVDPVARDPVAHDLVVGDPATAGITHDETAVGSVFVSNYPPFSAWSADAIGDLDRVLSMPPVPETPLGLYLHLPFCRKRCKFCYFRVYTDKNADDIGRYTAALAREVRHLAAAPAVAGRPLRFVYFGGGTPSYVSVKHLEQLVAEVQAAIPWTGIEEVTFECEPGTLTQSKLAAIRGLGVTRLSLGIENFDDQVLADNGRAHVSTEIDRCLPWIRELAFDQLNVDLIAGMVGETWERWRATVARTIEVGADSVTIYQMELPHNTVYSAGLKDGSLGVPLATWAEKREWNLYAIEELAKVGYQRSSAYTMARNAAARSPSVRRPTPLVDDAAGKPCRFVYRDSVWHGCDLLGTGVSSFSHLSGLHYQNTASWGDYLAAVEGGGLPTSRAYLTSPEDRLIRELILQLKLGTVELAYFRQKFAVDVADRFAGALAGLAAAGYLTVSDATIDVTTAGLLRIDSLLPSFYDPTYRGARYT